MIDIGNILYKGQKWIAGSQEVKYNSGFTVLYYH